MSALTRALLRQKADSKQQQTPIVQRTGVVRAVNAPGSRAVSALVVNPLADPDDKPVRVNSPMHVNPLESQWDENIDALRPERAALMKLPDATSRAEYIAEALAKSPQADRLLAQRLVSKLCSPTDLVLKGGLIEKLAVKAEHHAAVVLSECIEQANEVVTAGVLSTMIEKLGERPSCLSDKQKLAVVVELMRLGSPADPYQIQEQLLSASNLPGRFFDLLSCSGSERVKALSISGESVTPPERS